jgi:fumarylacetoacetate (FAA) hydrolase family protein
MRLVQFFVPELGKRVGVVEGEAVVDITEVVPTTLALLERAVAEGKSFEAKAKEALDEARELGAQTVDFNSLQNPPSPDKPHLLLPIDSAEIWGAGVTYKRRMQSHHCGIEMNSFLRRRYTVVLAAIAPLWGHTPDDWDGDNATARSSVA